MRYIILFLAISFLTISCQKKQDSETDEQISIQLNVSGIIDVDTLSNNLDINKIGSISSIDNESNEEVIIEKSYHNGDEFDAIVSLVETRRTTSKLNPKTKFAGNSPMASGIAYKAYIYKRGTTANTVGDYVGEISATSGTASTSSFKLERSTDYTIIAFSWNTTTSPTTSGTTSAPILSNSSSNQELLYFKSDFDTRNAGPYPATVHIPIVFQRQNSAFQVEINSMGVFAPITEISASLATASSAALRSGQLDLITGQLSGYSNISNKNFSFPTIPSSGSYSVIANNMYTAEETTSLSSISITIASMTLSLDNNEPRSYGSTTYNITTPISLEKGKLQKIRIQLINKALPLTRTTNSPQWAQRNLYYNPLRTASEGGPWRMRDHNSDIYNTATNESSITQSYWNFNTTISGADPGANKSGDPCSLAYPEGTWRLPTRAEYTDLINNSRISFAGSGDARYMIAVHPDNTSEEVKFIKYGYRNSTDSNLPSTIVDYNYYNSGGYGYYATSSEYDSSDAYIMKFQHGGSNIVNSIGGNYNVTTTNLNKAYGVSTRCVRNTGLSL